MLFFNDSFQSKYLTFNLLLQVSKKVVASLATPNTYTQLLNRTPSTFFPKPKHHYAKNATENSPTFPP